MPLQAGYNKSVTWQPDGGAAGTLDVVAHSWEEAVDKILVDHSGLNGLQGVLAGILRGDGTIRAVLNTGQNPAGSTVALRAGQNGRLAFDFGFDQDFSVPCLVIKLLTQSEVAGRVEWTASVTLNALASTGTYTRQGT